MKKAVFGAMMLGLASLGYSQSTNGEIKQVELTDVTVSPILNSNYRNTVQKGSISPTVKNLEDTAARFELAKSPKFDPGFQSYQVVFRTSKGRIIAIYDSTGKILSSNERFKDIALPPAVRNSAFIKNPGWTFKGNNYLVSYSGDNNVKKVFKVQMVKDNLKRNLKLDMGGNRLN